MIRCLFFAMMAERLQQREIDIEWKEDLTVSKLKDELKEKFPEISPWINTAMTAVNEEYVPADTLLHDRDVVAFIPPVSGG